MSQPMSRATFLSRGASGGIALVAGGSLLAASTGPALAAPTVDADMVKLAATAELLAIDFYSKAIASGRFKGDELRYLLRARVSERAHYKALAGVLKSDAPSGLAFMYPAGTFDSRLSIAKTGVALETAFVGAYLGAVTALQSNELKGVAATIAASEASHLSVFSDIAAHNPIVASFPKSLSAGQATKALAPFLS